LTATETYPGVVVIGATNMPWQIDAAFLRRLPLRCFVSLPNTDERIEIFQRKLKVYILE